ncbi:MAG: hypothetical protein HC871_07030 [Rhizobiales bacterium]|nr:hypothetical protein [Hyphomicrobiales bacterium]
MALVSRPPGPERSRRAIYRLGREGYLDLLMLSANSSRDLKAAFPLPEIGAFPLTGRDLLDRQVQAGPHLGRLLGELEGWWLDHDQQPDRDACLKELDRRLDTGPTSVRTP